MKTGLHPHYHSETQVTCTCGHTFTTGSTQDKIQVDICSKCHPFFTGETRYIDLAGRVDKFQAKQAQAQKLNHQKTGKSKSTTPTSEPQTLKDMLKGAKKAINKQD